MACIATSLRMHYRKTVMGSMQSSIEDRWKIITSMISVPVLSFFCMFALLLRCGVSATVAMARRCTSVCGDCAVISSVYLPSRRLLIHRAFIKMRVLPFAHYINASVQDCDAICSIVARRDVHLHSAKILTPMIYVPVLSFLRTLALLLFCTASAAVSMVDNAPGYAETAW